MQSLKFTSSNNPTLFFSVSLRATESGWDPSASAAGVSHRAEREPLLHVPAGTQGILIECLPGDQVLVKVGLVVCVWMFCVHERCKFVIYFVLCVCLTL